MIITNLTEDIAMAVTVTYKNGKTAISKNLLPGKSWITTSTFVVETITALMAPNVEATPYVYQKIPSEVFQIVLQNPGFAVVAAKSGETE